MVERQYTVDDLDRALNDGGHLGEVYGALAGVLRQQYGDGWLLAWRRPDGLDLQVQGLLGTAFRTALERFAAQGYVPAFDTLRSAATDWLTRLLKNREEQWKRLGRVADQAAQTVASRGSISPSDLFLNAEVRPLIAAEVARQLPEYLGVERSVASDAEIQVLAAGLVQENLGAGALEDFLQDRSLSEVMVIPGGRIMVEQDGMLRDTGRTIPETRAVWFAERMAAAIESRIDKGTPAMDGFLPDGSRVHAVIKPISLDGTCITIRRHARRPTLEQLLRWGAVTDEASAFLQSCVSGRANILISGGTSSGKTSLLNVVAGFIPTAERIITMEDSPELRLPLPHVIRLRTRQANIEDRNEVSMRDLVRHSLRMRPDRIVVGEVRGAEALDMVEALNTGHDGGLSTAHANGPLDMLKRLGQMMKRGDPTLTDTGAYELIASAIHVIVHAERRMVGDRITRGVQEIVEVVDYHPDRPGALGFELRTVFRRDLDLGLAHVGTISHRLATHLQLNGIDPNRWRGGEG